MKRSILLKPVFLTAIFSITLSSICYASEARAETKISEEARYPLFVIDRPSTMPTGIIGFDLNTGFKELKNIGLSVGAQFGIAKRVQGSISWDGFSINTEAKKNDKFNLNHTVNLGLKYNYLSVPHISASATLSAPLHIADSNSEILRSVSIGVPIVFYNSLMAGGILNNLLTINMRPDVAAKLDFEWWYGIQAYDKLWLDLTSSFGTVVLKNQKNIGGFESKPFWEKFPITLGATYAVNHYFDLGANVGFEDIFEDIRKAKNTFKFGLTFTTRAGRLFG